MNFGWWEISRFSFVTICQLQSLPLCLLYVFFHIDNLCTFCSIDKGKQSMFVRNRIPEVHETCCYTAVHALSVSPLSAHFREVSGQCPVLAWKVLCAVTWQPRCDWRGWSACSCKSYRSNPVLLLCMGSIRLSAEMLIHIMKDLGLWNIFWCILQVTEPPSWQIADEIRCRKLRKVEYYLPSNI